MRNESIYKTTFINPFRIDAKEYLTYAYNLRFKGTYSKDVSAILHPGRSVQPDAHRNPGYPLFISAFVERKLSPKNVFDITFSQMILSCITLVVALYVFQGFLSKFWALMAAFLTAISPHLIVANSYVLTETLFCLMLVGTVAIARLFAEHPSVWRAGAMGVCLGCGFLVRPSLLYFPFVALVFFYLHCGPKRGLVYFAGLLTGFMLLASPWYVRNLITLNKLSDSHLKITFLHHGLYPDFTYNGNRKSFGYPYAFDPRSDEIDQNTRTVLTEIANRFQNRPLEHIYWYVFKKPVALWSWNMVQGSEDVFIYPVSKTPYKDDSLFRLTHRLAHLLHWPIVVLAITGFWVVWFAGLPYGDIQPKMMLARFIATLLIYFTFLHMIGVPFPRYSVPLRPLLYAMAMFTLSYGIDRIRIRFWPLTENTAVQEALSESMHEVL